MKKVMVRAWEIAREAVKKFGGKTKSFFSQALKMAWEEVKGAVKVIELKGTEKQIEWATDIIKNVEEVIAEAQIINYDELGSKRYTNKMLNMKIEAIRSCADASKIIATAKDVKLVTIKNNIEKEMSRYGEVAKDFYAKELYAALPNPYNFK